jgi:hypothetical protein
MDRELLLLTYHGENFRNAQTVVQASEPVRHKANCQKRLDRVAAESKVVVIDVADKAWSGRHIVPEAQMHATGQAMVLYESDRLPNSWLIIHHAGQEAGGFAARTRRVPRSRRKLHMLLCYYDDMLIMIVIIVMFIYCY